MQAVLLCEHERRDGLRKRSLYDGKTQEVAAEAEGEGADGGGGRAGDKPQRHAQHGQAGATDDDLVLQRHEQTHAKHGESNPGLGHDQH